MCGIAGCAGPGCDQSETVELLFRQLEVLHHRGPDSNACYFSPEAALGHVRLSIIDPAGGGQPMQTMDGRYVITFNGEIYNYLELKRDLEAMGEVFQSASDTEVLLLGYARWGREVLPRLNGMFAFAIYDSVERSLFCARDALGQKPFYFSQRGAVFFFASEVSALSVVPDLGGGIDRASIEQYVAFESFYCDRTIFSRIRKLPPGHFLTFKDRATHVERWFSPDAEPREGGSPAEYEEEVHEALKSAVRLSCRADVPVAILLSGGLDSSTLLADYSDYFQQDQARAFHVHLEEPTFDELKYAKAAASQCGVELETCNLSLSELGDVSHELFGLLDEPQADPGILAKYFICRHVARTHKVVLGGDGADELFYGYVILQAERLAQYYQHVPDWIHRNLIVPCVRSLPSRFGYMSLDFRAKRFISGFPANEVGRRLKWMYSFSDDPARSLFSKDFLNREGAGEGIMQALAFLDASRKESLRQKVGPLGRLARSLQRTYLPNYVLCNSDRASMLNSVEMRSPYLDVNLIRLANALPDSVKMPGLRLKHLLKKVAERRLSRDLVNRRKVGFTVPVAELMRSRLQEDVRETLSADSLRRQDILSASSVERMMDLHFSGRQNLYKPLWTIYSLQKWLTSHKAHP